ncbi:hypothetical protein L2K70_00550 [Nocardioides KLBMP 9356]|uniref:Uncharacterized protein n=1 Tax=Nocardioides potassii TaxID=2911371 RepID=A0ABS9H6L6_9ACTN|nr:hypothetical protein [Nocardioides potassii]MCF6376089.1 hypothetical protein [Nocardioides potassii]
MTTDDGTSPSSDDEAGTEGVDPTGVAAGPNPIEDADAKDLTDGDSTHEDGTGGTSS